MGGIIVACLTALYVLLFLFFIIGVIRTHRYRGPKATPSVSVVVPMRNEEEFAQRTLEALAEQDYRRRPLHGFHERDSREVRRHPSQIPSTFAAAGLACNC